MNGLFKFLKGRTHKNDEVEFKETKYSCVINDRMSWHSTKDDMLKYIESYSKINTIYSLSMFRNDLYNLIK